MSVWEIAVLGLAGVAGLVGAWLVLLGATSWDESPPRGQWIGLALITACLAVVGAVMGVAP